MSDRATTPERPRSSRRRYQAFVQDYKRRRLDDSLEEGQEKKRAEESGNGDGNGAPAQTQPQRRAKRRQYMREYLRWLWPHRFAVGALLAIALVGAGLEMVEPLFMRFMVDGRNHISDPSACNLQNH